MKLLSTFAFWVISLGALMAQPTFTMSDDMPMTGDTVEIDVTVEDFTRISSIQYLHGFDSLVLDYIDVIDKTPNLAGLSHLGPEGATVDNGQIVITWNDPLGENVTLPDGETIYTIQFLAIGGECDSSLVNIIEAGNRRIEVLDEDFENIGLNQNEGKVKIPGEDCEGGGGGGDVIIRANMASGANGAEVCLQVRVDNFEEIEAMQFSMGWDPDVITYSRVANFNLPGLTQGLFNNNGPGVLSAIWDSPTGLPITVANNTRIFDLCFNVVGMEGEMSDVDFTDTPLPIEFTKSAGSTTFQTNSGKVTVTGGGGGGDAVEFILGEATGDCGDCNSNPICIPLTVRNFDEVSSMQFSINYPPELEYCRVQNFTLLGLTAGSVFNPSVGVLRVVWDDPNGDCQTIPDNQALMEVCFSTMNGDQMYDIEVTDTPLPIEVLTKSGVAEVETTAGKITVNPCGMTSELSVEVTDILDLKCADRCQGFISLNVTGGVPPYELIWSKDGVPFDTTSSTSQFNLCGGVYSVKITDSDTPPNMITQSNIIVDAPDPLMATLGTTPVTGNCDGEAWYEVKGGTPPYSFRWSNGSRDSVATNLCKGDYNCTISDSEGCTLVTDTFTLAGPPLVFGEPQITEPTCYGDCDGAIMIEATGGCGDLTYMWAPGQGIVVNDQNQSGLCAGTYTVTVTDTMGTSESLMITVNQPDSIKIELDSIQNGTTGGIFISVTGGTGIGTYVYAWRDSTGILVSQDQDLTNVPPGTYTVTVTDQNGCMRSKSWTVSLTDLKLMADLSQYEGGVNVSCFGQSDGSISITVADGVGPFTYSWDHDPLATGPLQTGLPAGTYRITVMDQANGSTKVITVTLTEPDILDANIEEKSCAERVGDPSGSYEVIPSGGTAPYTYLWCNNNDDRVPLDLVGGENCNVLVTDANGCQVFIDDIFICVDDTTVIVDCFNGRDVITPNGDDFNEFLIISCLDDPRYDDNELFIFNRWGQEINAYSNYRNQWNGLDEDGNEVDEDTYMWVLKVVLPDGNQEVYRGAVTLLRN